MADLRASQWRTLTTLALLAATACGGGERQISGPDPSGGGPSLAKLVIDVGVASEDSDVATALGWGNGVPGATVRLLLNGTETWNSATTNAQGRAEFPDLLRGLYRVHAGRVLTQGEADGAGLAIRAFGDGATLEVDRVGDVPLTLSLAADHPGGLVISEINGWTPPPQETGNSSYNEAGYLEVYNNSDQTLFLDGKVFGVSIFANETVPTSCETSQAPREDPTGVYSKQMVAFPGGGGEYPILPGETKVIAVSAIDHTSVHPDLFDLSGADFELRGVASADNPAVPDMLDIGLQPFVQNLGGVSIHRLGPNREAFFLADPVDPQSLPIEYRDGSGRGWVRIPRESLIDVAGLTVIFAEADRDFPPCIPMVHRDFDRYEGGFLTIAMGVEDPRLSFQRRVLRSEGGRLILQNANTSAVDFMMAELTPGTLPNN